ncbi:GntR family transcriptional regulator [Schumannella sp. 10F1B-5-1]|uniref:GntR family transcriptional regulator n=1 Tax=Schumannella sp. 10F1B-5-1 TaxID=2590780 RepID=UPI001131FFAD|nr:GntR family transcriptional regulator [Schumannella sp. 10F1B-5-1]TPW71575.1 GntR family transcriptional regulator [Schumannella sp. 10F1B-5-1]
MPTATGTSKYVAVREHLLTRIRDLEVGTRLPAEPVLCDEYGVSRITLRHAVDGLIADGVLVREQGRGTFVSAPRYASRYPERFADQVSGFHTQQSREGHRVHTRVVGFEDAPAGSFSSDRLDVSSADRVARLTRLRYVNDALHHLAITDLPLDRFPGILEVDFTDGSLFDWLRGQGVKLARNEVVVSIDTADTALAEHLGVDVGEKVLRVDSTVFDADDRAVSYGTSHFTPQNSEIAFGLHG